MSGGVLTSLWPVQGKVLGWGHWERIELSEDTKTYTGLQDTSTGLVYHDDAPCVLRIKALYTLLATPGYAGLTFVFHLLLRPLIATIYLFGRFLYEASTDISRNVKDIAKSNFKDWTKELKESLRDALRTPFYAIAFTFSLLFTLLDPLNGRKITAAYEFAWNHDIPLDESIHIIAPGENFKFSVICNKTGFYIPGCFQPIIRLQKNRVEHPFRSKAFSDITATAGKPIFCLPLCFS